MNETKIETMATRGKFLPVGVEHNGSLIKPFEFRPWRMKEEKAIGELRDKHRNINVAQFVSMILATMLTKLGAVDFDELSFEKRKLAVSRMYMADVYYAYVMLRINAIGSELPLQIDCPLCGSRFDYFADLFTTDVRVVNDLKECSRLYKLRDPFLLRGKEIAELILGPAQWSVLESISGGSMNTGLAKSVIIRGSIWEIPGRDPLVIGPNELDDMSKFDIEQIIQFLNETSPGPDLSLSVECSSCGGKWQHDLDWNFDSFFAISSK